MVYANPKGHDWGNNYNWDGLGISYVAFAVAYSLLFYTMCGIVWYYRKHPLVKMRKIGLAISALLILHVYLFMIFVAYALNGHYPCIAEFWFMSFYLPMGIGLFQAQNQQLLLISRLQQKLVFHDDMYKPLSPTPRGLKKWAFKLKQLWAQWTEQSHYEGLVAVGMVVQFLVSTVIFLVSRKFTGLGIVSQHVSKGMCRRGWEWAPSIVWQFVWNWILGPILIWKIRMIRDIYHWRLQTILCIMAGLPGSPMWLLSAYSDRFAPVNKYWIPAAWFVPGLITMEMVTLGFPLAQVYLSKRAARRTNQQLVNHQAVKDLGLSRGSSLVSFSSKGGRWSPIAELDECIRNKHASFLKFATGQLLMGENVQFLLKVLNFKKQWDLVFTQAGSDAMRARYAMYRAAVNIYVCMVCNATAIQQINVESHVYKQLDRLFGEAAALVASARPGTPNSALAQICPWEEPLIDQSNDRNERIEMANFNSRLSFDHESTEPIVNLDEPVDPNDKLVGIEIPIGFNKFCFDEAYASIRNMVWSGPWQTYVGRNKDNKDKQYCAGCRQSL